VQVAGFSRLTGYSIVTSKRGRDATEHRIVDPVFQYLQRRLVGVTVNDAGVGHVVLDGGEPLPQRAGCGGVLLRQLRHLGVALELANGHLQQQRLGAV
jgi:hypothetical protein